MALGLQPLDIEREQERRPARVVSDSSRRSFGLGFLAGGLACAVGLAVLALVPSHGPWPGAKFAGAGGSVLPRPTASARDGSARPAAVKMSIATAPAPERTDPGAASRPEWANKEAPKENFMASDPSRPDLSGLRECPRTRWDTKFDSVEQAQQEARAAVRERGEFPLQITATPEDNAKGRAYFAENRASILAGMQKHGAVWLRGFHSTKDIAGFRAFWEELGLLPCLDPIHSSGLRKFASERDAVYEEVNKPALAKHYIGLHEESSARRAPAAAAFVSFKPASEWGGRFIVADGAEILANMEHGALKRMYDGGVRISVSNLDTPFKSREGLSNLTREAFKGLVQSQVAPKFDMDLEMIYEADGTPGRLQAVEEVESPINRHPVTGVPAWFCNAHNHMRYLRDRRPCGVPEVGMTDVFLGQGMETTPPEVCDEVKRAAESAIVALPMEPGDVLLIDNYRALHGRETFEGDRYHAVSWFTWEKPEWREGAQESTAQKDGLNKILNTYLDWLPKDFDSKQR
mmetsp:Transcript_112823/g.319576  ORF Transcript_112823/g.319576 Transcript_112823/m.319576 type:complete len:519 (-) Transcript_112823:126-1682(-)